MVEEGDDCASAAQPKPEWKSEMGTNASANLALSIGEFQEASNFGLWAQKREPSLQGAGNGTGHG